MTRTTPTQPTTTRTTAVGATPTRTTPTRTTPTRITTVTSRENAALVRTRKLVADPAQARRDGVCWIEGDHLLRAARAAGVVPRHVFVVDEVWSGGGLHDVVEGADAVHVLPQRLMTSISTLESPPSVAAWIESPAPGSLDTRARTVVLDRLQDPGNVGSILRSAAAFGYTQVLALHGTVALWSAKVVRAAMGAHFALRLHEGVEPRALWTLELPLLGTSSHADEVLGAKPLPAQAGWLIGHEGQGADPLLLSRCERVLRIGQPGGQESLNAAAAAAICMHAASMSR